MINKKKHSGLFFMLAGLLLIAAAAGLLIYNILTDRIAGEKSSKILNKINEVSQEKSQNDTEKIDYSVLPDAEMPEITVDGYRYIGRVDIPDLGVSLPVMSEWSYPNLRISPCRYKGSSYTDDLILAAHNYRSHFGSLRSLKAGAAVVFTDVDNNRFEYEVTEIETLNSTDTERMESGEWDLTLFTCTYGGQYRVTARCSRVVL